ncbi:glycosyltransferase [Scytonema hofmannii FACHB-248]|uniref:Glycosyltransferase n=1 Tax=Scytonema hofmannii FACHB-248 TaxID=1842502 RepID=A0ABR8GIK9_9CYAN|nr:MULTISPECIES: glycosyltransferase family 2 protein [Nostocales]MBD2603206.1 glycosyltransferase [Scytonema hofmannii FACHB-248]
MSNPLLTIIIPTHNRPHLVNHAIKSALEQTVEDLEVIVVDDASTQPLNLPEHPRLRLIRLSKPQGGAAARNVGTDAACGRWVTYLDDDDRLLPNMVVTSLKALSNATLPEPIAVISGVEVVNSQGQVIITRLPPPVRPRGAHFSLEEIEPGYSYNTKQTLVVEREVLHQINGWDEKFRSRVHSELFLRLNPVCSILGLPVATYQLTAHDGVRLSRDLTLRQESFQRLVRKHESIFKAHPKMFASFVYEHALKSYELGQRRAAFFSLCWAMQIAPFHTFTQFAPQFSQSFLKKLLVQ